MKYEPLVQRLLDLNISIGSVESFTGGLFGATLVNYPGVSKIYKGSIVAYSNEIKHRLLKIKQSDLDSYGAVSSKVALDLARKGKTLLGVDFCFAFTGNAGPSAMDEHSVGDVFISLVYGEDELLEHIHIKGDRAKVRIEAVNHAFKMLERVLENYI